MNICKNGLHDKDVTGVSPDGKHTTCTLCRQARAKKNWPAWYARHGRLENRARIRRTYLNCIEKRRAESRATYWKNREARLKYSREWREKQKALYGSLINAFWARQVRNSQ